MPLLGMVLKRKEPLRPSDAAATAETAMRARTLGLDVARPPQNFLDCVTELSAWLVSRLTGTVAAAPEGELGSFLISRLATLVGPAVAFAEKLVGYNGPQKKAVVMRAFSLASANCVIASSGVAPARNQDQDQALGQTQNQNQDQPQDQNQDQPQGQPQDQLQVASGATGIGGHAVPQPLQLPAQLEPTVAGTVVAFVERALPELLDTVVAAAKGEFDLAKTKKGALRACGCLPRSRGTPAP